MKHIHLKSFTVDLALGDPMMHREIEGGDRGRALPIREFLRREGGRGEEKKEVVAESEPEIEATPATPTPTTPPPQEPKLINTKPPPKKLLKVISQAILQWGMIRPNDRLLLGLSGGKDSLSLLHCLLAIQKKAPVKFTIACCTIDPMTPSFDPSPLIPYVESLGVEYHYIRSNIIEKANTSGKVS